LARYEPFPLSLYGGAEIHELLLRPEVQLVTILTAFCDETGTHAGAPLTSVGGYVFDKEGQQLFSQQWAAVLQPLKEKGIRYFRASACQAADGPFANLSSAERDALFGDLIRMVRGTGKFGMAAGIEDCVFQEVMHRNKVQGYTGTKYTACALRCLTLLGQWADENNYEGGIEYLFESGNQSQSEADHMMRQIADNPELASRFRYVGHGFHPKYSLLPLQAADLLVWLWQKACAEEAFSPYFQSLRKQPGAIPHYVVHLSDTSLNIMAIVNMHYGVRSNQPYESQEGNVRIYTV